MNVAPLVTVGTAAFPAGNFFIGTSEFRFYLATMTTNGVFSH